MGKTIKGAFMAYRITALLAILVLLAGTAFGGALSADRSSPYRTGQLASLPVAASTIIYAGSIVAVDASGNAVPASTSTAVNVVGVAMEKVDNSSGSAGALNVEISRGVHRLSNSSGADLINTTNIGATAYAVDDQTVALTDSSGTRVPAGKVVDKDSTGVWVDFGFAKDIGQIQTNDLANNAITTGKILDNTVTSGDIANGTIANADIAAGAVNGSSLAGDAVSGADKIADDAVSLEHLDSGITPSHIASICNITAAENDADATVTETHASISATDVVVASVYNATNEVFITNTIMGSGTVTFFINGNGGSGTRIGYCAHKAAQ